ncbi:MAG: SDR family NAD(P)-dependent oxidoreductase, partial [Alphaproteobacteria bacterium]|nr:SDR family NAD(P)-dependent oxidoreductase [Alphaproteobacteria bacterium]
MKLDKRVAVVTGASKGIGRAMALALAEAGADVVVTARSGTALDGLAAEIADFGRESLVVVADLGARDSAANIAAAALDRFGRIDILVNNAAVIHPRIDLADFDPDLWREVIEVNLTATAMLTKAVLPSMIERGAGKIINISSLGGRRGGRGRSAYRATKAALFNLTECVASEVRRHGIDVTCICPGGVDTEGYR